MTKVADLDYYKKLNYSAILKHIGGNYYLFVPELSLVVKSNSLDEAYKKLESAKEALFSNATHMDVLNFIKTPASISFRKKLFLELTMFFTKTLLIVFLFVVFSVATLPFVQVVLIKGLNLSPIKELSANVYNKLRVIPYESSVNIYNKLKDMSDEDKEKMRLDFRKILQDIKPFVDEIRNLSRDENVGEKAHP